MGRLTEQIEELSPWFHNLHLPDGSMTAPDHPLGDFPSYKWKEISPFLPDISGWKVLDIGCNAGFYSFELAKMGAIVRGIDIDQHYLDQASWAASQYGLQNIIEFKNMQVYDLAGTDEKYDLVWYMGVFYHLRYPFLSLDIVSRITSKMMVFQTLTLPGTETYLERKNIELFEREVMNQEGWPRMAFIEHSLADDPTNWWAPNHCAVMAMLRATGFRVIERPSHEVYICEKEETEMDSEDMREKEYLAATGLGRIGSFKKEERK
ncbi:MAG: TIGR04290 family methyltransferase [Fibrobacter sp.]|jgi:tRNA (mo5U34)-methyltransferase|nr:TIGR04290 family methyltransferase [Fibrobacter sp.]